MNGLRLTTLLMWRASDWLKVSGVKGLCPDFARALKLALIALCASVKTILGDEG